MDCYEWRSCDADCESCEVANMDIARAVQHWPDADFMTNNYSPEEVLGLLRQLGERAERAEHLKQAALEKCDSYANRYAQAAKERDRYTQLLKICSRFVGEAPEVQVRTDEDEIIDGLHLVAHIEDVLEGKE